MTLPDAEFILGAILRNDERIFARVSGALPASFTRPWIRVQQLDAKDVTGNGREEYVIEYFMQFDCYAGSEKVDAQLEASELSFAARQVLMGTVASTQYNATISAVTFVSHAHLLDDDFDPPRERYSLSAYVTMHG